MNFFSPGFRPIDKTNTHKINSVILKLNTNLKNPVSKYFETNIEINKQRLIDKYKLKPELYKWTKRDKPKYITDIT